MIKLSELKGGLTSDNSLTSLYLNDNVLTTVTDRDVEIAGPSALKVTATGGVVLQNGTEGTIGDVWTSVDTEGRGQWVTNPTNMQFAYQATPTVFTADAYGDFHIAGTEAFRVTATNGILATKITTDGYDLVIDGYQDVKITTNLYLQDGSEGVDGYVWTSQGTGGLGSWELPVSTLQQAYENNNILTLNPSVDLIIDGYANFDIHVPTSFYGRLDAYGDAYLSGPSVCIQSNVKIDDGTQVDGYVFTTDAYGNASWQEPVSDLQGAYETSNTLTTSSTFGDLIIDGTEKVIINTDGGLDVNKVLDVDADAYFTGNVDITGDTIHTGSLTIKDGSEGTIGDIWTSTGTAGEGAWTLIGLQEVYDASNLVTTSAAEGDFIISGTESVFIDAASGLDVSTDAYFTGTVSITGETTINGELIIKDGSEGVDGYVWTSTDTTGGGSWQVLPSADAYTSGTVSREFDSGESSLGAVAWSGDPPSTPAVSPSYRCIRVGNRVDVWFVSEFTTPGSSPSESVTFELPATCPAPTVWFGLADGKTIAQGSGGLFDDPSGTDTIDRTNEVSLYKDGSVFKVTIVTFARVENNYGASTSVPITPLGFNAHITYFTDA